MTLNKRGIALAMLFALTNALYNAESYYYNKNRTIVLCHRGQAAYFPENSLQAFATGAKQNCDFLELDLQISKDGTLIVMHDIGINRTSNVANLP